MDKSEKVFSACGRFEATRGELLKQVQHWKDKRFGTTAVFYRGARVGSKG